MAQIPLGTKFIGGASTYPMVERRSTMINDESAAYTMQDIIDTTGGGQPGPQGVQGPVGPQGPIGPVGPAGLTWQGAWTSGNSYVLNDAVGYNGASYFCIAPTSGTTPPDLATANWALLASQGAQGPIGPTGAQGPTGATGPSGFPAFVEFDLAQLTIWNNGGGNQDTNTSFGNEALVANTSAVFNTAYGSKALKANTTGGSNTGIGTNALAFNVTGASNTAIGSGSLGNNTSGGANTAVGVNAMIFNLSGNNNTAVGFQSMPNATGSNNAVIGSAAATGLSTGSSNVAIGYNAMQALTTGGSNVVIGPFANVTSGTESFATAVGRGAVTSTFSTVIGSSASSQGFQGCVVLGIGAQATANNQFVVGSATQAAGSVSTAATTPTERWRVKINNVDYYIPLEIA